MIMCNFHYVKKWVLGKFKNFSIAQNLRKIEFGDYRIAKSTTLTRGSEFWYFEFLHFLKADIYKYLI